MNALSRSLDPKILEEAADWLVTLHSRTATDADRTACLRWQSTSADHARAWARAQQLTDTLGSLPSSLAMASLDRSGSAGRRATLQKLALLLTAAPSAWLAWDIAKNQGWTADYRTAIGERRTFQLADGTQIMLNSASAINVRYDATSRLVQLQTGEMLVKTAPDTVAARRPFFVDTAQGRLEALGTVFTVRQFDRRTAVGVWESAVRIAPERLRIDQQIILRARQQTSFTTERIERVQALDPGTSAWTRGMLLADDMPLANFAAELARYRRGVLRVSPNIENLSVSGTFPIDDTDRTLVMLESTYPIIIEKRFHGYWVTLASRES